MNKFRIGTLGWAILHIVAIVLTLLMASAIKF